MYREKQLREVAERNIMYDDGNGNYPCIDAGRFGRRLREICRQRNVTARELKQVLGLGSVQAVYLWFEGKRLPSLDNLYVLGKYLNMPMEELLEERKPGRRGTSAESQRYPDSGSRFLFYWKHLH